MSVTKPLQQNNNRNMQSQHDRKKNKPVQQPVGPQQITLDHNVMIEFTPAALSVVISQLQEGSFKSVQPVLSDIERQVMAQVNKKKDSTEKVEK